MAWAYELRNYNANQIPFTGSTLGSDNCRLINMTNKSFATILPSNCEPFIYFDRTVMITYYLQEGNTVQMKGNISGGNPNLYENLCKLRQKKSSKFTKKITHVYDMMIHNIVKYLV